jgi:hypothetical protein
MAMFSEKVDAILKEGGWHQDRAIDTSAIEAFLRAEGYPVVPAVVDFLRSFAGLSFVNPDAIPPAAEDWSFDVARIAKNNVDIVCKYYAKRVGRDLCVIGEAVGGYMLLMMDPLGRVYGGYDDAMLLVGNSPTEAIEALCDERVLPSVPEALSSS